MGDGTMAVVAEKGDSVSLTSTPPLHVHEYLPSHVNEQ